MRNLLWRGRRQMSRELCASALLAGIGVLAIWKGVHYGIGTLRYIRPGFFPLLVGCILISLSFLIGVAALQSGTNVSDESGVPATPKDWRGWTCIVGSIFTFIIVGRYGGLVPASFLIVFIAALGDRENRVIEAAVLAAAMTAFCIVVFWVGLGLQFPLFRWG